MSHTVRENLWYDPAYVFPSIPSLGLEADPPCPCWKFMVEDNLYLIYEGEEQYHSIKEDKSSLSPDADWQEPSDVPMWVVHIMARIAYADGAYDTRDQIVESVKSMNLPGPDILTPRPTPDHNEGKEENPCHAQKPKT